MDYEKKYNEALKEIRELISLLKKNDVITDNGIIESNLQRIFPELAESEDERIRKEIRNFLIDMECKKEWIAYMEKQKEYTSDNFDDIWTTEDCGELLSEGEKLSPRFKELFKNVCHAWYDKGIEVGEKQKESENTNASVTASSCCEVEQKVDIDKEKLIRHCIGLILTDATDERFKDYGLTLKDCLTWLGEQKEQKPASTEDMPYITDEHFYEREPVDSFKYKLAEYMTRCCTKKEGPYGYEYGISAETILKMAEEELLKRGVVQKPAEWSEEDEENLGKLHRLLVICQGEKKFIPLDEYDKLDKWLKSLRSSWKPSEEQMKHLQRAINCYESDWGENKLLHSLIYDLKKLM